MLESSAAAELLVAAGGGFAAVAVLSMVPAVRRAASRRAVPLVAIAAAALAWPAAPAATGVGPLDALLRSLAAVAVTLLAARAGTWSLLAAGGVVAVGCVDGPWLWVGSATGGVAIGTTATGLDAPVLRATLGGAVAVTALHLSWPARPLATAAMAATAIVLVGIAGLRRSDTGTRRVARLAALVLLAATATGAGLGAAAAVLARHEVDDGVAAARRGLAAARRGRTAEAVAALEEARASFTAAQDRLDAWWARPASVVPVVARHSRALRTLVDHGAEVADVGVRVVEASDPNGLRFAGGHVPLERLAALEQATGEARDVLVDARHGLQRVRSPWLLPAVRDRLEPLSGRIDRAAREAGVAAEATRIAPLLLGRDGPRRYFLALQTPAELRATGGFIGNFAEIAAEDGTVRLDRLGRISELNEGGLRTGRRLDAPADYLDRYSRFDPHLLWQNVNMSPDFPTVARVVAGLYPQSGGRPVDGVVAIDPSGLAALLGAVGPITVDEWPEPITAENAERVLLFEQYVRLQGDKRIDFLGQVTAAVWQRLIDGSAGVVDLGRALAPAVAEKHVMLAAALDDEQATLVRLGAGGAMEPVDGDFVGVVTQNAVGNKIDWFLRRAVDYRVRLDPRSGYLAATMRVTLANEAPASGLPAYVIGSALVPPLPPGTNRTYVSLYTPWLLTGATLDGKSTALESERELDRHVYSAFVDIPPGRSVVLELALRGERGPGPEEYVVHLHRQPTAAPDDVQVTIETAGRWRLCDVATCRRRATERLELVQDHRLSFGLRPS